MQGKTLLMKERIGFFEDDFYDRNSKGKKSGWFRAWAKKCSRKIRRKNKIHLNDISILL